MTGILVVTGAFVLGYLAVVYLIFSQLQRLITEPILHLAQTMRVISKEKDYAVRFPKESGGEIGDLIDGFNEMLGQIQLRDKQLGRQQEELEEKVALRTAELMEHEERTRIILSAAGDRNPDVRRGRSHRVLQPRGGAHLRLRLGGSDREAGRDPDSRRA